MTEIGKYQIIRELGKGATSCVYLARDSFADRQVALKVLNLHEMKEEEAKRFKELFLTEASLAGKIEHPYIVSIYDAVISDEISYLVMEFVGGGTLERYCQIDNLLPIDKVIEIVFKCCHALKYASQNGIVHRDIKPENILIADGTNIKISDFGAAIVLKGEFSRTNHNMDVGSLAYMSPQQAQGMELSSQADIYSLGVMFYKLLTGSLPFFANNDAGLFFQILHEAPRLPSTYRLDIPKAIDDIVSRAIAKNLEDRYQSWNEFEQALVSASVELTKEVSGFNDTEKFNTLSYLSFFKDFGELELWEILHISKWAFYPEGTSIIREGDETASFFIIISGEAEIRKNGRGIATLKAGVCFGEMSGVRKGAARRRTASVFAHKDIKLIEINEQALGQSSENCQRYVDKAFLEILAERLASAGTQDKSKIKPKVISQSEAGHAAIAEPGKNKISERPEVNWSVQVSSNSDNPSLASSKPWVAVEIVGVKLNVATLIGVLILIVLIHFFSLSQLFQTILGHA